MLGRLPFALVLWAAIATSSLLWAGDMIDGLAATVNGVPILQSDVEQAVRCETLLEGRPPAEILPAQRLAVLERLVDQELLRQQMATSFPSPKPEELAQRMRELRQQLAVRTDQEWNTILDRYGLSEEEVAERVNVQMQLAAFVDLHLQSGIQIDPAAVRVYYQEKLLPTLHLQASQAPPPLSQVSSQIEQILRQEREGELLSSWLRNLRQQSRISTSATMLREDPPGGHGEDTGDRR